MIQLQGDTAERLNGGIQVGGTIELPFFTPRFWALNGDARLMALGGAQYFGGFAVSAEDMAQAQEDWGVDLNTIPFAKSNQITADGKTIEVYTARNLIVAPITIRTTWTQKEGGRFSQYVQGTRQHVQAIAYLAVKSKEQPYQPLGPIMMSAKGYQAKNLMDAFSAWDRQTKQVRGKIAPGVPAWCFYLAVGTFGNERKQLMVGKTSQSPITPISAYIPKEINEQLIESLFVGEPIALLMADYLEQSREWLHAYDARTGVNSQQGQQGDYGNGNMLPMPDDPPDEIPW